jgi:hypothetical protein
MSHAATELPTKPQHVEDGHRSALAAILTGIAHCRRGEWHRALAFFEPLLRDLPEAFEPPGMFYSWAGRALAKCTGRRAEAVRLCERGATMEFYRGDCWLNLAWAHLHAGSRRAAVESIFMGLDTEPDHGGLKDLHDRLGVRRSAVLPFLPRGHCLNVQLGRLRHAWLVRRALQDE